MRYVHTNIIARDPDTLIAFYKDVLNCRSIGETRDLCGEWLDRLTGLSGAHIVGEHLCLPGYDGYYPTLEIFGYGEMAEENKRSISRCGFAHIAFAVEDVEATLRTVLLRGGGQVGELVSTQYADGRKLTLVYATDPEGNILELQSWS